MDHADKLKVSSQTIIDYEEGKLTPDIETLKVLGHIFNVTIDQLVGNSTIGLRAINTNEKAAMEKEKSLAKLEKTQKKIFSQINFSTYCTNFNNNIYY